MTGPDQAPPPFLEAIRQRGNAPPSANRPGNPILAKAPSVATPVARPPIKTAPVVAQTPAPSKPVDAGPVGGPTPSAAALMAGLKAGQIQLKPAGSAARGKQVQGSAKAAPSPRPATKAPIARVPTQTPHLNSPQPLSRSRTKTGLQSTASTVITKREVLPSPPSLEKERPAVSPPPAPKGSTFSSVTTPPTMTYSTPHSSRRTPQSDAKTTPSPEPTVQSAPQNSANPSRVAAQAGLQLHKSGKYQVIVDAQKLKAAFQRLTCKYS